VSFPLDEAYVAELKDRIRALEADLEAALRMHREDCRAAEQAEKQLNDLKLRYAWICPHAERGGCIFCQKEWERTGVKPWKSV